MKPSLEAHLLTTITAHPGLHFTALFRDHCPHTGRQTLLAALSQLERGGHIERRPSIEHPAAACGYWRPTT